MGKCVLWKDPVNTIVCNGISDCYVELHQYLKEEGSVKDSRIGKIREVLNFKTVINNPMYRCLIAKNRNVNIFFHLAESLWTFSGRDDLEFIKMFNSRFSQFSDDGVSLHGAYGKRLRFWENSGEDSFIDQLRLNCSLLAKDSITRRSVISFWDPVLDLGTESKDIPCNTQIAIKIHEDDLHLTIFNRSNDLHWGYVTDIFQFSFMGEIISLLLNKHYASQTHISQSLHIYEDNDLINNFVDTDIHTSFYQRYPPTLFQFSFINSFSSFEDRFSEIDLEIKGLINSLLDNSKNKKEIEIEDIIPLSLSLKSKSRSLFEIAFLLFLSLSYQNCIKHSENKDAIRCKYADFLMDTWNLQEFIHKDFHALALNYFVKRISDNSLKLKYLKFDPNIGTY